MKIWTCQLRHWQSWVQSQWGSCDRVQPRDPLKTSTPIGAWNYNFPTYIFRKLWQTDQPTDQTNNRQLTNQQTETMVHWEVTIILTRDKFVCFFSFLKVRFWEGKNYVYYFFTEMKILNFQKSNKRQAMLYMYVYDKNRSEENKVIL